MEKITLNHAGEPNRVLVGSFLSRRTTSTYSSTDKQAKVHYSQISGGKREILSIDDDPTNQMVVEDLLIPLGYVVTCAMDGVEGLEILASRDYLPDLILLDVQMPLMTGYEVCAEIRRLYPESLPIIMISANHDESSILEGLNMGSNDYVQKPFSRAQLVARIDTHLRSRDGWMAENKRSNDLLGQVFPEHVTQKLKHGEAVISEAHDCVTVLFSDIVGYTSMSTSVNTADVFDMLNKLYTAFDALSDKHGVYKVDTIGDAYMVAAGHEESSKLDHHLRVFAMAKDMLEVAKGMLAPDGSKIKIRIGIHTGPAYFGIVGVKCPKYTLIGDTVNIASRMESNGFPMCIHVSSATQKLLHDVGEWQYFGCREIKGKGSMVTYVAKVGAWEAALAALALKDTCDSPIAGAGVAVTRCLADVDGPSPVSPLARALDGSSGGDATGVAPLECALSLLDDGGCGHCGGGDGSPARRPARLEDSSTQTDAEGADEVDGKPGLVAGQKLRFRERRSLLHKSMSNLQQRGVLAGPNRSQQSSAFSQSALAVLMGSVAPCEAEEAAGWVVMGDLMRLVAEVAEARREAAEAAAWVEGVGRANSDRRASAEAALGAAEKRLLDLDVRLVDALRRADAAEAQETATAARMREAEARADDMTARVAGLEGQSAARRADDDRRYGDAGARALAAEAASAASAACAREAERRAGELAARVDALEREAVERQLDDNYVQAVSAERAKALERDKADLEARLETAISQAATAEAAAAAAGGRGRELERRCAELVVRAEAAERAQSQGSTAVVSPQQEASGAWSRNDEQLRDALQRIRIYEVERASAALLLGDLSRRYDEAAAALSSGCAELARTQALLRCEQRIAEQLREEMRALRQSPDAERSGGLARRTPGSPAAIDAGTPCGHAVRRAVEVLVEGMRATCSASPCASFSYVGGGVRSEVDEVLGFLGLGHYAGALRREDVTGLSMLAQLSESDLAGLGVCSAAARMQMRAVARGLQALVDRARDERRC